LPKEELKNQIEQIANQRIEICNGCLFHSDNREGYKSLRQDKHCTDCGCTLSAKTKCLSCACPKDKWGAVVTKTEEDTIDEQSGDI